MKRPRVRRTLLVVLLIATVGVWHDAAQSRPVPASVTPTPASWSPTGLTIAWIGHASVLIDFGGTRILTDPTFFERVGVQVGPVTIGARRLTAPALRIDQLPRLDAVVVSHAHMDSLDRPSLAALHDVPLVVTPPATRDLVDDLGFRRVVELGWSETIVVGDVEIRALEVNHWGRRWPWGQWRGYNGYLFTRDGESVLFASDTAYTPKLGEQTRGRRIAAAILGIGAYDPWIHNHADPEQAWQMFRETGATAMIPIHWDTFRLGKEPLGEAMTRLLAAARGSADRVVIRRIGETWSPSDDQPTDSCASAAPATGGTADTPR